MPRLKKEGNKMLNRVKGVTTQFERRLYDKFLGLTGVKLKHCVIRMKRPEVNLLTKGIQDYGYAKTELQKEGGDNPKQWIQYLEQIVKGMATHRTLPAHLKAWDLKVEVSY